ncbi:DUF2625 family protein [Pantoea allii]|uniref:DUF2625 family protein n=1 Tax=Pantoea allii TaxID=574096 RepID=UPI003D31AC71
MRELTDLIDPHKSGWLLVQQWFEESTNNHEILPCIQHIAAEQLHSLQLTTQSLLGTVLYETGGILVDNNWLRILGSGHLRLTRTIASWTPSVTTDRTFRALLVADDLSGGFFALNGGEFGNDIGVVYYLAPETLKWESLEVGYSGFLRWALCGDLDLFYQNVRWAGWREETSSISGDAVYSFYPFLWTEPQLSIKQRSRVAVPVDEHWLLSLDLQQQLSGI